MLFEWLDEWFKFTWNTWDLEQPPERRALWRNALTNEEQFGLIAADTRGQPASGGTGSPGRARACSRCGRATTRSTCTCGCASTAPQDGAAAR